MVNKEPKTIKGKGRKLLTGDGRTKTETAIRKAFKDPVRTVDEALGGKKKKGK